MKSEEIATALARIWWQTAAVANSSLFTHHSSLKKGVYVIGGQKYIIK